jgi:hypothetical protein
MHTKTLNVIIFAASKIINLLIILYFAVLLAKLVWWLINPALGNVYIEKSSATEFEKSVKYVNNRYPFGIVAKAVESAHQEPPIATLVKLNGIYFNPPKSIAFITYSGKSYIVSVGDKIMGDATLMSINTDLVVVNQNGADATIKMNPNSADDSDDDFAPDMSNSHFSINRISEKSSIPMVNHSNHETDIPSNRNINNDIKERRKKLIEDFAQKTPTDPSSNNGIPDTTTNNNATENIDNSSNNEKNNHQESNRALNNNSNGTNTVQTNP